MSAPLIGVVTIIYLGVALSESVRDNWPMAIVWFGYSLANLGFIALALK